MQNLVAAYPDLHRLPDQIASILPISVPLHSIYKGLHHLSLIVGPTDMGELVSLASGPSTKLSSGSPIFAFMGTPAVEEVEYDVRSQRVRQSFRQSDRRGVLVGKSIVITLRKPVAPRSPSASWWHVCVGVCLLFFPPPGQGL